LVTKCTLLAAAIATALPAAPSAWAAEPSSQSARPPAQGGIAQSVAKAPAPSRAAPAANASSTPVKAPATKPEPSWPKTLPEATAEAAPEPWPAEDIARAKAHCAHVLNSVGAVAVPVEPIKEGLCGAPAPVQLSAIGASPQVAISPPATLTCEMVAALGTWLKNDLQPLAQRHLGAPIVRINTMSSYSCRNAPGRGKKRLSEHGRANALDISGFVTATTQTAALLDDWGMTGREAQVAAATAAEEKRAAAEQVTATSQAQPPPATAQTASREPSRGTIIEAPPDLTAGFASATPAPWSTALGFAQPAASFAQPSHLGGPKPQQAASEPPAVEDLDGEAHFLRAAHTAACRIFGTVLGPESNEAHRNHLHLDMAERASGAFCQ
jgi:hypothetical protein